MPVEEQLRSRTLTAGSDLSASQYFAVSTNSSGQAVIATAGANMDGIVQNNPKLAAAATVGWDGGTIAAISASQSLTPQTLLEVDSGGTLKAHASGTVVAKSKETLASTANVCLVSVEILRSNASF
jgi:hypothetical protein